MKQLLNPVDECKILQKHLDETIIFAVFVENNISSGNNLNISLNVILNMGVVQTQYKEWHGLSEKNTRL
jgi:hypothetical protein